MIAIVDYGVGNLFSLCSSFAAIGESVVVTADHAILESADKILLPGVGAFEDAIGKLQATGIDRLLKEFAQSGKLIMGICLGMQLLFEESYEYGYHTGLGLIPGSVVPMEGKLPTELKIPHIGWNALHLKKPCSLFENIQEDDCVYFVHSFYADQCDDYVVATAEYGIELTAAVARENVMGCQFHPEKSGAVGLAILKSFAQM